MAANANDEEDEEEEEEEGDDNLLLTDSSCPPGSKWARTMSKHELVFVCLSQSF